MLKRIWMAAALMSLASALAAQAGKASAKPYDAIVKKVAQKYIDVPSDLIHAIIRVESNYDAFAISEKGAMGLMQLMPDTARAYGVKNVFDPEDNIEGGTKYLRDLIRLFNRERDKVLAAYNAGQEAVKKYNGIPPYKETINYINRITYKNSVIRTRTPIYRFYDKSGRCIITNDLFYYQANKKR